MAISRVCSVDGCSNPSVTRGWCAKHYARWRRVGSVSAVRLYLDRGVAAKFIRDVAVPFALDECLRWPYTVDPSGRARVKWGGSHQLAHRLVCRLAHGDPPTAQHEVAHSCGCSHLGCVNPRHLRWATHTENEADKKMHGTSQHGERNHQAKLTNLQVVEIRKLKGSASQQAIADRFGVSQTLVGLIHRKQRWI